MSTRFPGLAALAVASRPRSISPAEAQRAAPAAAAGVPDIPFQKFVLQNGLTLIVHEDHKAPIVAVNVWYHVGSKNEKPRPHRVRAPLRAPHVQRERELQRASTSRRSSRPAPPT